MFKRFTINAIALSAFLFTMLCLLLAATAQAQVEPQQGAINTTRSNIKNTSRTDLQGQIADLRVEISRYGGAQFSSGAQTQWSVHKIDKAGEFNLGFLPAGQYELRVTRVADADKAAPAETSSKKAPDEARAPSSITITLNGIKGGSFRKDLALTSSSGDGDTAARRLDGRISSLDNKLGSEVGRTYGPGRPVYGHIFETDGKSEVKGTLRHELAKSSIGNTR